jgi:hypothetical protein
VLQYLVTANVVTTSLILFTLMMEAIRPPKRRFLQESHGVTSQKMALFKLRLRSPDPVTETEITLFAE